ncbi:MAG: uracil-DNA glycosylase family protein [bacterium]
MTISSEIFDLTERYLVQQSKLYGQQFYLDDDFDSPVEQVGSENLEEFCQQIKNCEKCNLSKSRTKFVFGVGNPKANLMCVGEAPGFDEDRQGEPFVGAAGQLLNRILAAIGFQREEVYIANIVKCRPPSNRDPNPEEIAQCLPYLKRQIAMIQPKVILALGRVAGQTLLDTVSPLGKLRGSVHQVDDIKVVVTFHPAALLRNRQWKRGAWQDVQMLRKMYDQVVGDKPFFETT